MVGKDEILKGELVDEDELSPRFRDAVFGIRNLSDLSDIVTNPDYNPHVHIIGLLLITIMVGLFGYLLGA